MHRILTRIYDNTKKLLPTNKFARSVSLLVGGSVSAQFIMILSSPVLTRLYTPDDFGLLAIFAGILGVTAVIASLRYELAIPLPESDQEAADVTILSLCIAVIIGLLVAIGIFLWGDRLSLMLNVPQLAEYLWLLPLGVFFIGSYQIFKYWAIRSKDFSTIAATQLKQKVAMIVVQIMGFKVGGMALLCGQVVGQAMGSSSLALPPFRKSKFKSVTYNRIKVAAKRYRHFPFFSTWSGLFNAISLQIPPVMLAALFSPAAAGLFALAHRAIAMPMNVIGKAIGDVFFSNAAEAYRTGELAPLVAKVLEKLTYIAMPPMFILAITGPEIFSVVFGSEWQEAGIYARWLAPWLYFVFITSPLGTLFSIMEKQKQSAFFQGILLIGRIGAILLGAITGDIIKTIIFFSVVSAVCWFGYLIWIMIISGNRIFDVLYPAFYSMIWSFTLALPLLIAYQVFNEGIFWVLGLSTTIIMIAMRYYFLFKEIYK